MENPIYSKKSVKNNFVDASSNTDLVALFKSEIQSLRREMEKLEASNTTLQGHVEKSYLYSTHGGLEVSSKSGWKTFQLEDGRVYYTET